LEEQRCNPVKLSLPTNQQSEVGKMGFATVNPVTNPLLDEGGVLIAANAPSILGSSSSTTISFLLSVGHAVPKLVADLRRVTRSDSPDAEKMIGHL